MTRRVAVRGWIVAACVEWGTRRFGRPCPRSNRTMSYSQHGGCKWAVQRYRRALTPEQREFITISPAVLRRPNGELVKRVAVNGYEHILPRRIRAIRGPDTEVANDGYQDDELIVVQPINKHAEIRMKEYTKRERMSVVALGATNAICDECRDILDAANIPMSTAIRNPDVRPNWRPPDGSVLPDRSYLPPGLREASERQDREQATRRAAQARDRERDGSSSESRQPQRPRPPANPRPPRINPPNQSPNQGNKHGPRK